MPNSSTAIGVMRVMVLLGEKYSPLRNMTNI